MPVIPTPPIQGSPPPISSAFLRDFTGGINFAADDVQLPKNQFADALDIDPDVKGGFARRPSYRGLGTTGLTSSVLPKFLFHIVDPTTNGDLVVGGVSSGHDKLATYRTTDIADGHARTGLLTFTTDSTLGNNWSAALMNQVGDTDDLNLYIHRDRSSPVQTYQTDGALHTELADAYGNYHNRDVTNPTPTGGTNPHASLVCAHANFLFHADTVENSHRNKSRVRYSWEGHPGDYDSDDYFDVGEGQDNDVITAMVSWMGALFIFKELSVWVCTGYGRTTFALNRIGAGVGATNKNAVVAAVDGVYFFDANLGVQKITVGGRVGTWTIQDTWGNLSKAIDDGRITNMNLACMAAAGSKIAVSGLIWKGATLPNRTFIYDSNVGDGWWVHSVGFSLLACYTDGNGKKAIVGASPFTNEGGASTTYKDFICINNILSPALPDTLNGSASSNYNGYMFTSWVDAGDPARKKRFRRFSLTFDAMATNKSFTVNGYRNWSVDIPPVRTFTVAGLGTATPGIAGQQNNVRGGALGTAYSAALLITGPNDVAWGINQVTFRFVPKRVT